MRRRAIASTCTALAAAVLVTGCGGAGKARPDLAFVSTRDGDYAIFAMNADGSRQKRLTHERGNPATPRGLFFQLGPAWSPNAQQIAFSSQRDGPSSIYVMRADGSDTRRLTSTKDDDTDPTWSPDGRRIAFTRSNPGHIFVMRADGTGVRRITDDLATEEEPTWSPNGRWIAYVRREPGTAIREIWLAHPDGSGRRQLTHLKVTSFAPAWSPDSRRITFSSNSSSTNYHIYEIRLDGKGLRLMTQEASDDFEPAWSPDGRVIAFSRGGAIWTVDAAGGNEKQLTNPKNNDSSPAWKAGAKS